MAAGLNLQPWTVDGLLTLDLSNQGLTSIPEEVFDITNLENLDVSNNKLTSIPEAIVRLKKLQHFKADANQLTKVPPGVCSLSNLEVLNVGNNRLSTLPAGVEKLQKLRELYIYVNQLTEVPPEVCSLSNLEVLSVGDNRLYTLTAGMEKLQKLRDLRIYNNQLTEIPPGVGSLSNLQILRLSKNFLGTLPSTMSQLRKLNTVSLRSNKFHTFPEVLCGLPAMEKLDIRNNNITRLPTALHRADKLIYLDVTGNPLTYPPRDVCEQGKATILAFLRQEAEKADELLLPTFNRLSVKVQQTQWKPIARSLGLKPEQIDSIKSSAPDDLPDQVYQTLVTWREREGDAATLSALELHLRDLDFQGLVEYLLRTTPTVRGHDFGAVAGRAASDQHSSVTVDRKFPVIEFERLNTESVLGHGGFAYVQKAYHRDWRQHVAVKCLLARKIEGSEQAALYSEARKLNLGSRSDHVISLLGVCLEPHFGIVMPFMENGSLAGLLQDVDVPWALRWRMAHEISLGMTFLHCQNPQILHCDLKAENVLLDGDFHVKISDFGLSKWKAESRLVTKTSPEGSTITHAPPEYFGDINLLPTDKFDVYSFGVLLWEIITRQNPYGNAINSALIRFGVTAGQRPDMTLVPTDPREVTTVSELMQTCWSQVPENRPAFSEVVDKLRDVNNRSTREDIRQAIIEVERMKNGRQ